MSGKIKPTEVATAVAKDGIDKTVGTLKEGMATAAAGLEQPAAKLKEGFAKAMKTAEDVVAFNQGNVDAVMKSGQIWAAGMQDLSRMWAASAQVAMDETMNTFKAFAAVKSLKDMVELQSGLARASMERGMSESGRIADASAKLMEQTMAPITARVNLAVETFAKPAF